MTNIFFNLIDGESNPLTGSKVILRPFNPPYYGSGSVLTTNSPITLFSNITGSVLFPNVVSGLYKVSISPAGANNPSIRNNLQNFANTIFYIQVPELSGSTINGIDCLTTQPTNTGTSSFTGSFDNPAFIAYTIDAANAIFMLKGGFIDSASWAQSASNAVNAISASWATVSNSSSWASSSISASILKDNPTLYYRKGGGTGNDLILYSNPTLGGAGIVLADINHNPYWAVYTGAGERMYFYTSSHFLQDVLVDFGVTASGGFLGDLTGTASWATNAVSASWSPFIATISASWASQSLSASYAPSSAATYTSSLFGTASWATNAVSSQTASAVSFNQAGSDTLYYVLFTTSSTSPAILSTHNQGALYGLTFNPSSNTLHVTNADIANAVSSSVSASFATFAPTATSASFATNASTAAMASSLSGAMATASLFGTASWASKAVSAISSTSASWSSQSLSASYVPNLYPQTYQASGSWASQSLSASYAPTADPLFVNTIWDKLVAYKIDMANARLFNAGGKTVDWNSYQLFDAFAGISVDWSNRILRDSTGNAIVDWQNKLFSGSLYGSASFSTSASWAPSTGGGSSVSASWASQSLSASWAPFSDNPNATWSTNSLTANTATSSLTASVALQLSGSGIITENKTLAWYDGGNFIYSKGSNDQVVFYASSWGGSAVTISYDGVTGQYFHGIADFATSASWASASISSSYAVTASYAANSSGTQISCSWASSSISASYAISASWAPTSAPVTTVPSASWASASISSSYAGVANALNFAINFATSSTSASWASSSISASYVKNADTSSVLMNANVSITSDGNIGTTATVNAFKGNFNTLTASLINGTSSWANNSISASYAPFTDDPNALSASWASQSLSSSTTLQAVSADFAYLAQSSVSSSYSDTTLSATTASFATYAMSVLSASWSNNAVSASYATNATPTISASWASASISASYAMSVLSASWSNNAVSASYATNATPTISASWASASISASYASAITYDIVQIQVFS